MAQDVTDTNNTTEIAVAAADIPVRPEDKIPTREKIVYGAMDIFGGGQGSLISLLLMYYFTSVIGIDAGFAGTAVLIAKIWDAIIDPTFGVITDNTRTKLGRRRPYIIIGGALIIPAMLFLYAPIQGFGETMQAVWICVAYLVYCTVSSISQVPFNSMSSDISPDYRERNKANLIKLLFDLGSAGLCFLLPSLLLSALKSGSISYTAFYLTLCLGFGGLFSIPLVVGGFVVKERSPYDVEHREKLNLKEYFGTIKVKSFYLHLIMYVCAYIAMDVISAVALYYCENILNGMTFLGMDLGNSSIIIIGPFMVCAAVAVPLAYHNMRKHSKQFAYRFTIPGFIVTAIIMVSVQPDWSPWIVVVDMMLMGFFFGGSQVMPWLIFPDTVDVVELKKGERPSGSMGAVMTFCRTIATAFASSSVGWVLAGANYISHEATEVVAQPDSVATALRIFIGVTVCVLFICAFTASCFYKVTDKKLSRIRYFNDKARAGELDSLTIAEKVERQDLIKELCGD